ncbi:MAG TPA: helix-turn-helix transcriptional regulator [Trebonia sp.]
MTDPWQAQREALGAFIRSQRKMANLSLRQLAELTSLSNPYLSQVERGLHQPSVRVLKAISDALNLSAETLLAQAGLVDAMADEAADTDQAMQHAQAGDATGQKVQTEDAIRADGRLSDDQKAALIAVYRTMLGGLPPDGPGAVHPGLAGAHSRDVCDHLPGAARTLVPSCRTRQRLDWRNVRL